MENITPNKWYDGSVKLPSDYNGDKDYILVAFTRDDTVPKEELRYNIGKDIRPGRIIMTKGICCKIKSDVWMLDGIRPEVNLLGNSLRQMGIKLVKWMWVNPFIEE